MTQLLHPGVELSELYKQLDIELKNHLESLKPIQVSANKVNAFLCADLIAVRFNLLSDQLAVSDLWKGIRSDEVILDLVVDMTTSLTFLVQHHLSMDWATFLKTISAAMGVFNNTSVRPELSTLQDDNELERFVTVDTMQTFLLSNPWLATLFLIRRLPTYRGLLDQFAAQAALRSAGQG